MAAERMKGKGWSWGDAWGTRRTEVPTVGKGGGQGNGARPQGASKELGANAEIGLGRVVPGPKGGG